jgi:glutamate-ammonia-ligase adenylyltransferase
VIDRERIRREVAALSDESRLDLVAGFVDRMDDLYLSRYSPQAIAKHVRLAQTLGRETPVALEFSEETAGTIAITIVADDHFGELAVLCGLLSSFGLTIVSGDIHTFDRIGARRADRAGDRRSRRQQDHEPSAPKIVDVFRVRPIEGVPFDDERRRAFSGELADLLRLLGDRLYSEARDRVNLRLVERLDSFRVDFGGVLYPVDVVFDAESEERWTIMDVHAQDTPAFLYALVNALSMRGVYIHRVEIESVGTEARDRFFVADRQGRTIDDYEEQATLRLAIGLIKQFTYFLPQAPDPVSALRHFDQLLDGVVDSVGGRRDALPRLEKAFSDLAHVLGSSRFLWEDFLRMQAENVVPAIEELRRRGLPRGRALFIRRLEEQLARAATIDAKKETLNDFKDREMLAIDLCQLLEPNVDLTEFSASLTELAEAVFDQAYRVCDAELRKRFGQPRLENGSPCPLAIFGLGKFGGGELGYASDIELLLVYEGAGRTDGEEKIENALYFDRLVRMLIELVESQRDGIFEIDLRLRPFGRKGALASSLEQVGQYYRKDGDAEPFERQALVKLRHAAGDAVLGGSVEDLRDAFVYSGAPWDLDHARHLRWRQLKELVRPGERNLKHGAGGTIDIEYAIQYLQIMHGHRLTALRTPNTITAVDRLAKEDVISAPESVALREAYLHLRSVINALRMVRGNARDLLLPPPDSAEFKFLARRLGYKGATWRQAAERLEQDLERHMRFAHDFYVGRFGAPVRDPNATSS